MKLFLFLFVFCFLLSGDGKAVVTALTGELLWPTKAILQCPTAYWWAFQNVNVFLGSYFKTDGMNLENQKTYNKLWGGNAYAFQKVTSFSCFVLIYKVGIIIIFLSFLLNCLWFTTLMYVNVLQNISHIIFH